MTEKLNNGADDHPQKDERFTNDDTIAEAMIVICAILAKADGVILHSEALLCHDFLRELAGRDNNLFHEYLRKFEVCRLEDRDRFKSACGVFKDSTGDFPVLRVLFMNFLIQLMLVDCEELGREKSFSAKEQDLCGIFRKECSVDAFDYGCFFAAHRDGKKSGTGRRWVMLGLDMNQMTEDTSPSNWLKMIIDRLKEEGVGKIPPRFDFIKNEFIRDIKQSVKRAETVRAEKAE